MSKTTKMTFGMLAALLLTICGSGVASAQTVMAEFTVMNSFGSTISLDSASCTSGSISPPSSIANGSPAATFNSSPVSGSTLCTVRYHNGSDGCQFVIEATSIGTGFANTNAYEGSGGEPKCNSNNNMGVTGNQPGSFTMAH
jgi:hypothetical protein